MIPLPRPHSCQNSFWKYFQIKPPLSSNSIVHLFPFKYKLVIWPSTSEPPQREDLTGLLLLPSHCQRQYSQLVSLSSFPLPSGSSASLNILLSQWGNLVCPCGGNLHLVQHSWLLMTKLAAAGFFHFLVILYNIPVRGHLGDHPFMDDPAWGYKGLLYCLSLHFSQDFG